MATPDPPRLEPFFEANPASALEEEAGTFYVVRPWGDRSLRLKITPNDAELVASLNQLVLPTRLTAMWHKDSKDLEVIWGAIPNSRPEYARSFAFEFSGDVYACEFTSASERLKKIASVAEPLEAVSETEFRNLAYMRGILKRLNKSLDPMADWRLTSFWIRNIDTPTIDLVRLVRNLNFYMRYFDRETPCILVHDENPANPQLEVPVRFPQKRFPAEIHARPLDDYLLALWDGTVRAADPFRRYIHNYQILEYAAFYFLQANVSRQVKKIILAPDAAAAPNATTARILEVLSDSRTTDEQRFDSMIEQIVAPELIWSLMEPNLPVFCRDLQFDGGFCLPAVLKGGSKLEDLRANWAKVPLSFRKLRNALVHGRESRSSSSIAPSGRNYDLLRPWIPLASAAAMEVVLYNQLL